MSIFRSNKYIYAQIIDESAKKTIAAENDTKIGGKATKSDRAKSVGLKLAEELSKAKIKRVVFVRGRYKYLGRIKALVEGVREGGITI